MEIPDIVRIVVPLVAALARKIWESKDRENEDTSEIVEIDGLAFYNSIFLMTLAIFLTLRLDKEATFVLEGMLEAIIQEFEDDPDQEGPLSSEVIEDIRFYFKESFEMIKDAVKEIEEAD